jgi:hypothetical protein
MKKSILLNVFVFFMSVIPLLAQENVANSDTTKSQKGPPLREIGMQAQYEIIYKGHYCHLSKEKSGDDVTFVMSALPSTQSQSPAEKLSNQKTHSESAENFTTGDSLSNAVQIYKGGDATLTLKCLVVPTNKKNTAEKKVEQESLVETLVMTAETTVAVSSAVKESKETNTPILSSKGVQSLKKKEETGNDASTIPSKPSANAPSNGNAAAESPVKIEPLKLAGATLSKGLDMLNIRKKNQESVIAQSNKTIEEEDRTDMFKQGRQQKHGIRHHFSIILENKDKKGKSEQKYELFFEIKPIQ